VKLSMNRYLECISNYSLSRYLENIFSAVNIDEFVKSRKTSFFVIPAKAGIQYFQIVVTIMDSGFHRSDDFYFDYVSEIWLVQNGKT
jgi:hypothetical protein